jgi:hypothetical protein
LVIRVAQMNHFRVPWLWMSRPPNQPGETDSKEIRWKFAGNRWKSCKIRNPHNINSAMCRAHRSQAEVSSRFAHSSGRWRQRTWNYIENSEMWRCWVSRGNEYKRASPETRHPNSGRTVVGHRVSLSPLTAFGIQSLEFLRFSCTQRSHNLCISFLSFQNLETDLGNHNSKFCDSWVLFQVLGLHQN